MDNLKEILKAILFVAGEGVAFSDIAEKLEIDIEQIKTAFSEMLEEMNDDGIQLIIYNDKAQLSTNPEYSEQISAVLNPIREKNLTRAVLDVCAIIAYKQPITRLEIEHVRGVNSDYAVSNLLENGIITVVGRKDSIGKPLLFGTTDLFLKKFGLQSLDELPDYESLLERIDILKNSVSNKMFDYSDVEEEIVTGEKEEENISDKPIEELEEEILKEILNDSYKTSFITDEDDILSI